MSLTFLILSQSEELQIVRIMCVHCTIHPGLYIVTFTYVTHSWTCIIFEVHSKQQGCVQTLRSTEDVF